MGKQVIYNVEHMHFSAKKSKKDGQYLSVNNMQVVKQDKAIFENWEKDQMSEDIIKIKAYCGK